MKPLIGISCCTKIFGPHPITNHAASDYCVRAIADLAGGIPVLLPATGDKTEIEYLLARLDGILLTGSRSMVAPAEYGGAALEDGMAEDRARDATTLPLIRAAMARGLPLLAICRGLQELNVAMGGTLHCNLAALPGKLNHATPLTGLHVPKAHLVEIAAHGFLAGIAGHHEVAVNSLHHQAIDRLGQGLRIEAHAPDGTIEAVHGQNPGGFSLGVQWHPEFDTEHDPLSRAIFGEFGAAAQAWQDAPLLQRLAAD
jgi:putative glutamine amidotransferase